MSLPSAHLAKYGPWAIVTGASSGIGEHFARALAAGGFDLVLVARRKDRLDALASELKREHDCEVETVVLDLTRPDFCEILLDRVGDRDVGLLVNNAGDGAKGPFHEQSLESKLALLDLNCRAPLMLLDAFAPRLIERGRGGVIITSSIESVIGFPLSASYAATKAYATSLGEGLWGELRYHGVDVMVLEPGATDTELLPRSGMKAEDMMGIMTPAEVATSALAQLGKRPVFIAGRMNRVLTTLLSLLPRRLAITAAGKGMRDAIEKGKRR
jgi:short-subunit dehydrogenase